MEEPHSHQVAFEVLLEDDTKRMQARADQAKVEQLLGQLDGLAQVNSDLQDIVGKQTEQLSLAEDNVELATHRLEQGLEEVVTASRYQAETYKQTGSIAGIGIGAAGGGLANGATAAVAGGVVLGGVGRAVGSVFTWFSNKAIDKEVTEFNKRNQRGEFSTQPLDAKTLSQRLKEDPDFAELHARNEVDRKARKQEGGQSSGRDRSATVTTTSRRARRRNRRRNSARTTVDARDQLFDQPQEQEQEEAAPRQASIYDPLARRTAEILQQTSQTSAMLNLNAETVNGMDKNADLQNDILATSERVLKATSVFGRIKNLFNSRPATPEDEEAVATIDGKTTEEGDVLSFEQQVHSTPIHGQSEDVLDDVLKDLSKVHRHATQQNRSIRQQIDTLDTVNDKLDANTIRAAQLTTRMSLEL